uniref:Uncharacterized protein n=1 Tax=Octopus bimaculoides TaxID=37653 RepID=A0A0L8IEF0_OCTBM
MFISPSDRVNSTGMEVEVTEEMMMNDIRSEGKRGLETEMVKGWGCRCPHS